MAPSTGGFFSTVPHCQMGPISVMFCLLSQVKDQDVALRELEGRLGFGVRGFVPGTVAVPHQLQINIKKLHDYFRSALNLYSDGECNYVALFSLSMPFFFTNIV